MDQISQRKVTDAGFTILRPDDQPSPRIKYKSIAQHEWKTFAKFETKAARDRELAKYLELSTFISD